MKLAYINAFFAFVVIFLLLVIGSVIARADPIKDAVVMIQCLHTDQTKNTLGTGTVVSTYQVITAAHVVDDCNIIKIKFNSGEERTADLQWIGSRSSMDVAVVSLSVPEGNPELHLSKATPKWGQEIRMIGFPQGLPYVMTRGIIAAVDKDSPGEMVVDVTGWHGMSGGPLLNKANEIIGICSAGFMSSGGPGAQFIGLMLAMRLDNVKNIPSFPKDLR